MKWVWFIIFFCFAWQTEMACAPGEILNPPVAPGQCKNNEHKCSDGGCCLDDWECTVDRLPIYADPPGHGYCVDAMGRKAEAKKP